MKRILLLLALAATLVLPSCAAGPHQLTRTVDDWDHEMYVDSPLLNGVLYQPVDKVLESEFAV